MEPLSKGREFHFLELVKMPGEEQFFEKLGEIPVLNDGWSTAWNCYAKVRDYNSVTKFTLAVAESGLKRAAEMSTPVIHRYQPQINTVNTYACSKLDEIESKYPLIKQPSGEVRDACLEYVQPLVGTVKPVVTYVQDVVDSSKRKVNSIKTCSTNLVLGARDIGVNSVKQAVTLTLDTSPGRMMTRTVDGVLTHADGILDKYMPEEMPTGPETTDKGSGDGGAGDDVGRVEEMEVMEPSPERVVVHFKSVSSKLRRRMFQRAMRDFQGAKLRTMDAVRKLNSTIDLIDYAKKNLDVARTKVEDLWDQITETPDQSGESRHSKSLFTGTLEERVVVLGRILVGQVRSGVQALEKASQEAGQFVRHPLTKSKEYKELVFQFSTDISSVSVEKARTGLAFIQKKLQEMIDNVESPEWLAMDIEMEGIGLEEDDLNSSHTSEEETEIPRPENHI